MLFNAEHVHEGVGIVIELTLRLVLFQVDGISIDSVTFVVVPYFLRKLFELGCHLNLC